MKKLDLLPGNLPEGIQIRGYNEAVRYYSKMWSKEPISNILGYIWCLGWIAREKVDKCDIQSH